MLTYFLGVRKGVHSERAIRSDVAALPERTAHALTSMFEQVGTVPRDDPDRGWEAEFRATSGWAPMLPDRDENALLIEVPYGAHSARLLALEDGAGDDGRYELVLRGIVGNGTGARFHVREASDGGAHEVVTMDYVNPLLEDRSLAEMPTQAVYYRLGPHGFVETGRGEVYDSAGPAAWDIPRSVEPFLDPDWVREQRG